MRARLPLALGIALSAAACGGTEPSNVPPAAAFSVHCDKLACAFASGSTDEDGTIAGYAWTFGDGATSRDSSPAHIYVAPGEFTVTVAVTDDRGAVATASQQVSVTNVTPPPDNRSPQPAFYTICEGLTCVFGDKSSDPDAGDAVVRWTWSFGDATGSAETNPMHTFNAPGGLFTVTLTVTDRHGASASATEQVSVDEPGFEDRPPPEGGEIAFSREGKIYRVNTDGTGLVQLSAGPADSEPAWSPDGSRIAFFRGGEQGGIYVMSADGANPVRRASSGWTPTWSPDAQWLAFGCGEPYAGAICKVSADDDGSGPITVVVTTASVGSAAWSPDGSRIAFSSDWFLSDFWLDIWVVAPDGSQPTVLRSHEPQPRFDQLQPAWSPDGRRIALVTCPLTWSYCDSGAVAVMNADGSVLVQITTASGYAHPTWSPDGGIIAFASAGSINWVTADGSQRGRIIANGTSPAWRPR